MAVEVDRVLNLIEDHVVPLSFDVPRKAKGFAEDLFPPTAAATTLSTEQWFHGETKLPELRSLQPQ